LKQPQYQPLPIEKQILSIFAGVNGYLDNLDVSQVLNFENELFKFMDSSTLFDVHVKNIVDEFDTDVFHTMLWYFSEYEFINTSK
jgi:F0F1-type ATP synthase alpha subunit